MIFFLTGAAFGVIVIAILVIGAVLVADSDDD